MRPAIARTNLTAISQSPRGSVNTIATTENPENHDVPAAGGAECGVGCGVDRLVEHGADDRTDQITGAADHRRQRDLDRQGETGEEVWIGEADIEHIDHPA